MAGYWRKARRFVVRKVLHAGDTPHAVAMGTAIATFVAFLPLIGLQTILAVAVAALFRANKAICVPVVWISNPVTLVPMYGACFGLGRFLMTGALPRHEPKVLADLELHSGLSFFEMGFWRDLANRLVGLGVELWVGCVVLGLVFAPVAYGVMRWIVSTYRERRRRALLRKSLLAGDVQSGFPAP
jgi:hypothetical protein